jgi:hypothetical protein
MARAIQATCLLVSYSGGMVGAAPAATSIPSAAGTTNQVPSAKALEVVRTLQVSEMGVDHLGVLWAFNRHSGKVSFVTPGGNLIVGPFAKNAASVAADSAWGVIAVSPDGAMLRVLGPTGGTRVVIQPPDSIGAVAWIDAGTFAATPDSSGNLVEIWNAATAKLVRRLGSAAPVDKTTPGRRRLRRVWVHQDGPTGSLSTMDSYSGAFVTFDNQGREIRNAALVHPLVPEFDANAPRLNADAIRKGLIDRPITLLWNGFELDKSNSVWSVERASAKQQTMRFRRLQRDGSDDARDLAGLSCATYTFTLWDDWLITYSDPADPAGSCIGVRRMP